MTQTHQLCALRERPIFVNSNPAAFAKLQEALAELGVQSPEFQRVTVKPSLPFNGEQQFCVRLPSEEGAPYEGMPAHDLCRDVWTQVSAGQLAQLREHGVCVRISRVGAPSASTLLDVQLIAGDHGFAISKDTEVNILPCMTGKVRDSIMLVLQLPDGVTL